MTAFRDWLNTEFGADGGRAVQMVLALLLVVALLLALAWLFRRILGGGVAGGKGGRLAVVDATHVDNRRRLVLLRRDDVEHLVMIGGPNDILVESRILRAPPVIAGQPGRMAPRTAPRPREDEQPRPAVAEEPPARPAANLPGMAAIGAAMGVAGAFVRARTHRASDEQPAPDAAPAAARATVDMAFDTPLGRTDAVAETRIKPEPQAVPQPVPSARRDFTPPPIPPRPAPAPQPTVPVDAGPRPAPVPAEAMRPMAPERPQQPQPQRAEAPRPEPVKPEPIRAEAPFTPPAPVPPAPIARPQPPEPIPAPAPVNIDPVRAPHVDQQERLGLELERALADLGLSDDPIVLPHTAHLDTPPAEATHAEAHGAGTMDLLSELDQVVAEQLNIEPAIEPAAAKIEPRFEAAVPVHVPHPAPSKPARIEVAEVAHAAVTVEPPHPAPSAPPVVPIGPADTARFEHAFAESLSLPSHEPAIPAPPVTIPAPAADHAPAPEVVATPTPVKTPVDELEEEMARLLSEISAPTRR